MIVQAAAADGSRLAMTLDEHLALADQLRAAFRDPLPEPAELLAWVVRHHDDGWREEDAQPALDPDTGLPRSLDELPIAVSIEIANRSIERARARHAWCGLIVSAHYTALDRERAGAAAFVEAERRRQHAWIAELARDPATSAWIETAALSASLAHLQLFDGLAVFLQLRGPETRASWRFDPLGVRVDADGARAAIAPWLFAHDTVEVAFTGRRAMRHRDRYELGEHTEQRIQFTRA